MQHKDLCLSHIEKERKEKGKLGDAAVLKSQYWGANHGDPGGSLDNQPSLSGEYPARGRLCLNFFFLNKVGKAASKRCTGCGPPSSTHM